MSSLTVPPILATLIGRIGAAVPARVRTTFLELLIGAAATKGGHVTDAILAIGLRRAWTTYYWLLEYGRWSWLHVWQVLPGVLTALFAPAVWHVIVDDTVVERISTRAPGSVIHHNHHAKPNRPHSCVVRAGCAWPPWSNGAGKSAPCR
jgi:DDE superfamily endonuclease